MDIRFDGKVAVVTGAGKGIGKETAIMLDKLGATVIAVSRTKSDLDELAKTMSARMVPIVLDVADVKATQEALGSLPAIDLVVNNAGIARLEPFLETKPELFDETMNVNVRAALVISQIAARNMIARKVSGSIVNVSSHASLAGLANHASYCASKGALDQLTRVMAVELGPHNIRSNCVNPTVVMTDMGRLGWSDPAKAGPMLDRIPLKRFIEVPEVVHCIVFLLSDRASAINGTMFPIDGGLHAT
eukprot:m.68202 g.68202  ORF g.68202 m.68202 type:complete len:246 (+) comp14168_c0_seq1:62-799(+)